jgi:NTP pyrophosphatase (non-canonical NTP hydrolase)
MELKNDFTLFGLVKRESTEQIKKWGIQDHTPFEWMIYLTEEHGELAKAISEYEYRNGSAEDVVAEAIQVATLSLKIAEMYMEKRK